MCFQYWLRYRLKVLANFYFGFDIEPKPKYWFQSCTSTLYIVYILSACLVIYRVFLMSLIEFHEISIILTLHFFQKESLFSMIFEDQKYVITYVFLKLHCAQNERKIRQNSAL